MQKDINNFNKLVLRILESKTLDVDTEIVLNCYGVEVNGTYELSSYIKDKENTGITKFGSGNKNLVTKQGTFDENRSRGIVSSMGNRSSNMEIDYQIPDEDNIHPRHFDIKFDFDQQKYFIRNYRNSAVFFRIDKRLVRKQSLFSCRLLLTKLLLILGITR